jgi:amidohydrolase
VIDVNRVLRIAMLVSLAMFAGMPAGAAVDDAAIERAAKATDAQVVAWRRDIHQHPELGNREFRTSKIVADELRRLGFEVRTGVAYTGVVGVLRGDRPGPTIALRADMDALPVTEQTDLPFKSVATAEYRGQQVGVMHACGHDGHTAILLGVARVLASLRPDLPGTVVFVFQPAEEGPPEGEEGGAPLMIAQNVFGETRPQALFGLHLWSALNAGQIGYRSGPFMAALDDFRIVVHGRQTHGAMPWGGVDPIVAASQVVLALQAVVAREVDITRSPAVVSVGGIRGGIRNNIIPDSVELIGTIRTFDRQVRDEVVESVRRIATSTAASAGATATVEIAPEPMPAVVNPEPLASRAVASLTRVAGQDRVTVIPFVTGSEDFAYFGAHVPSFFFFVGSTPPGQDAGAAPRNHSPSFLVDEASLALGVRSLVTIAVDYLQRPR